MHAELALDADGTFLAFRGANTSNIGAHAVSFHPLNKGMAITATVYRVPAVAMHGRAVVTNTSPTTPYRSAGRPEIMFVMERLIDLAARRHGFDRLELRRKNLVPASAMPYRNAVGTLYDSGDYLAAQDRALALADWAGFEARRAEARRRGRYRGIGVANYIELNTGFPRERAHITVRPEGSIDLVLGTLSSGQGHATSFAQLIVEWLGVELSEVRLVTGDTDVTVVGGGAHSARALRLAAVVMAKASDQIVEKGVRIAAWLLEAAEADIEFSGGPVQREGHRPLGRPVRGRGRRAAARCAVPSAGDRSTGPATRPCPRRRSPTAPRSARSRSIPRPAWSTSCATRPWTTAAAPSIR